MSALTFVLLGIVGLMRVLFFVSSAAVYVRHRFWLMYGRPAALRKGCRVCGGPAVRASWHSKAPRPLRPFGPTITVAWCQRHFDEVRARNRKLADAAAK